ncbi:MAG: HAD-IC family P-type ATPase [Candidatus Jorgensenbacteria bacterium]
MHKNWHARPLSEIFREVHSQESGLTTEEAAKRIKETGFNTLPEPKYPGVASIFLAQFLSPLIYVLVAAAVVVLFMGETADAVIIFLVLIFNAIMGTVQEGKAQRTLLALRKFVETSAAVLRDGKIVILPDKGIVPGDVIIIQEGDKIPADARIISVNSLKIDEASLTGESAPVGKIAEDVRHGSVPIHDQKNMVFKGTHAVSGNGKAVVVTTGLATEIGKISKAVAAIDTEVPLKKNIRFLSRLIITTVFSIGAVFMVFGLLAGESLRQMFATVVSLSVSIIPEGLPIVMTLVLASGVWRMTKRNVLVKKLQAVEALGQANIIAVDKTGTLTKNEMVLEKVYVDEKTFDIEGRGYEPKGRVLLEGTAVEPLNHPELVLAGRIASFCSNAHAMYVEEKNIWKVSGDPTEAALGVFGRKIGFRDGEQESPKIFELPFDYITKYHVTIHKFDNKNFLTAVGAPEKILELCDRVWRAKRSEKLSRAEKDELESVFFNMSRHGFRVLAFAVNPDTESAVTNGNLPPLIFGGFFGMKDPLREEVKSAVQKAKQAGIRVVMITGDHKITAHAIAEEAGFADGKDGVITGEELEKLSDEELLEKFGTCNVFARVTPEHKLRIIELFRKRGEVVAMTGDGVNDAPSLAAADLGVAMGKIGTEVAKEAADLVLLDDNFGNIISAVEEGRSIYKTIKKVILYLFSTSIGEVLTISGAMFLGFPLPLLPVQIIWLNFVTDGFLDVSLAMEPREDGLLGSRYTKPARYILDSFAMKRMVFMGIIIALGALFVFAQYLDGNLEKALTMTLTTLAVFQWFNVWNCKSEDKSVFSINPFKNMFLVGAMFVIIGLQLLAVYHPFMQRFLHTVPLTAWEWVYAVSVAASILLFEEARKLLARTVFRKA